MSTWNRPMRPWRPADLRCAGCTKPVRGDQETRMVGAEVYHLRCAPLGPRPPELEARIARRQRPRP